MRTNEATELEITERKHVEGALRETERFLTNIFTSIQDGISILDKDMNIIRVNPAMEQWYSHAMPLVGKRCYEAYQSRSQRCDICPTHQTISTGKSAYEVIPKRGANGDILGWFDLFTFPLIDTTTGNMKGVIEFVRDITKRKQAEEALHHEKQRFQTLSDQAPFGMMMIDKQGAFKYVNPKFKELFGYDLADVPNGKIWFRKAYPDPTYRHHVISDWLSDLEEANPGEKRSRVFTATCKDGSEKIVNFISVQLREGENLVTCEDFTDQIRAEEALRKSEEESKNLAQENAIMAEIGRIISSTLNIDNVYERFAERVRDLIPFDRIAIDDVNPRDHTITISYAAGLNVIERTKGNVIPLAGTLSGEVVRTRTAMVIQTEDLKKVKDTFPPLLLAFQAGLRSLMAIPLISKDEVIGVLHFESTGPNAYGEKDLRLAERISNQIAGAIANAQLFMERQRTEKALRESEERYRTLAESAQDTIFIIDREGHFQYMNHFGAIQRGNSTEKIIEKRLSEVFSAEVAEQQMPTLQQVFESGKPFLEEIKIGADRWEDVRLIPILAESGKVQSVMGIARDITERKRAEEALRKSEEKFQKLFDEAPVGYMELNADGCITQVNRTGLILLGYTADEMLGQPIWKFVVEEEAARETVKAKLSGSIPCGLSFERTYKRKDGSTLPVVIEDALIRDADRMIAGIHSTIRDVTERKRAEKEMADLQEQLRQSQKIEAIGRLAGGIAHDFNNLLTVIKGYAQLSLLDLKENNPLWENIQEIQKATRRATDLTRQLLAFSRRQILNPKVLDLNSLLRDTEKMLRRMIGEDIELITLLSEDLGRVKIDPSQIEQVIFNLAVNARDAMPSGGKLTIGTDNVASDDHYVHTHIGMTPGHYVRLSVSDTGVGMSREVQEKAFDPFFTTKDKGKGTGLGLSTVHGIVTQSGGKIWVYSEPGHGTTFKIYFPTIEGELENLKGTDETESFPAGSETILLVEDEPSVRDLANRLLKQQGYTVMEAANAEEALRLVQENIGQRIHLLLTDVVLPQMGGKELAEKLTVFRPDLKVLYTSGYTDYAIVHHGVLNSGIHFLQKPFSLKTLSRKVREVLDK